MPSMRRSSGPGSAINLSPSQATVRNAPRACPRRGKTRLLVLLSLPHDFLRAEIDAAGWEGIADEEIVGVVREIILAFLEVRIGLDCQRQLDFLRHHLALPGRDGSVDRNRNLGRTCAGRGAFQALG